MRKLTQAQIRARRAKTRFALTCNGVPEIVVVAQFDDQAIYVNGRLLNGGDCKLVNGAIDKASPHEEYS
jgi:hypothetical protein